MVQGYFKHAVITLLDSPNCVVLHLGEMQKSDSWTSLLYILFSWGACRDSRQAAAKLEQRLLHQRNQKGGIPFMAQ